MVSVPQTEQAKTFKHWFLVMCTRYQQNRRRREACLEIWSSKLNTFLSLERLVRKGREGSQIAEVFSIHELLLIIAWN